MNQTCNGWPNAETWRVQLHMANNTAMADRAGSLATLYAPEANGVEQLAEVFREWILEGAHAVVGDADNDGLPMLVADFVDAALGRVDWHAIARAWMERVEATA